MQASEESVPTGLPEVGSLSEAHDLAATDPQVVESIVDQAVRDDDVADRTGSVALGGAASTPEQ